MLDQGQGESLGELRVEAAGTSHSYIDMHRERDVREWLPTTDRLRGNMILSLLGRCYASVRLAVRDAALVNLRCDR